MTFVLLPTSVPPHRLAESINASATSFKLDSIDGWDGAELTSADFGTKLYVSFRNSVGTLLEFMEVDPATITDASAAITILKRGLKFTGDRTTEVTANKLLWVKGDTIVHLGTDMPQMFQSLVEYVESAIVSGALDGADAVKGIYERGTTAEIDSGAASGSTTAPLAVTTDRLAASIYNTRLPSAAEKTMLTLLNTSLAGFMWPFAGSSIPTGWLECDGSAVSRATYAALFTAISTTWGVGDGSTTFNLPDFRGAAPIGAGTRVNTFTFDGASAVDPSTNLITVESNNWLHTGQAVALTGSALPTGLSATTYYVIRISATTIKLASSLANAQNGTVVDITADGSGTCTLTKTLTARSLGDTGGEETHAMSLTELLAHTHTTKDGGGSAAGGGGSGNADNVSGSTGGNAAMNNMSPYGVAKWCIKT